VGVQQGNAIHYSQDYHWLEYVRRGSIFEVAKNDDDRRLWHLGWVTVEIGILVRERSEEE